MNSLGVLCSYSYKNTPNLCFFEYSAWFIIASSRIKKGNLDRTTPFKKSKQSSLIIMFLSFVQLSLTNNLKYQETLKPQNVTAPLPPLPLLLLIRILLHQRVIHFPIELFIQVKHVRRHGHNIVGSSVRAVIKRFENEREDNSAIVFIADGNPIKSLAIPEQQDFLCDLRITHTLLAHQNIRTGDTLRHALKKRHTIGHDILRLHQLQQIFQLV